MDEHWKIKRDPFFNSLYEKEGIDSVMEAGYFDSGITSPDDVDHMLNIPCTPLNKAVDNLKGAKKPCVMIMPGSFCPPHDGHIEVMNVAKEALERRGFDVIAGYMSPGSDSYITEKNGDGAIPVHHRIKLCDELTRDTWIDTCPWEGLFNKYGILFTEVVYRMELYLKKHLGKDIPVYFVTGGDKANYAKAFKYRGNCVVVNRPLNNEKLKHPLFLHYFCKLFSKDDNIIWAECCNFESSTEIRKTVKHVTKKTDLYLRVESADLFGSKETIGMFHTALTDRFNRIDMINVSKQISTMRKISSAMKPLLSLDAIINGDHNLRISRQYDLFGNRMIKFDASPGFKPIEEQLSEIRDLTDYVYLYDDDIHTTGGTIRYVTKLLNEHDISVNGVFTFKVSDDSNGEILDMRDFLVAPEKCGLVVKLPNGKITRAPYMYPFVCPHLRASILDPMEFSIEMWQINMENNKNRNMKVGDLTEMRELFLYSGHDENESVYSLCGHYLDMLNKFIL